MPMSVGGRGPSFPWARGRPLHKLRCLRDGAVAGLLAGAFLLISLFFYDLVRLQPFETPHLLSAALLGRSMEPNTGLLATLRLAHIVRSAELILTFTLVHMGVFLLIGMGAALFFARAEPEPGLLSGALYGLVVCSALFHTVFLLTSTDSFAAPDWRVVLAGNLAAGALMGAYLRYRWIIPVPSSTPG